MSLNAPFDARTRYSMGPHGQMIPVQRGWIEEAGIYTHSGGARRVDFLFAPSTITTHYSMGSRSEDLPLPSAMDPRDDGGRWAAVANQTLTFQLLFDRAFEVRAGDTQGTWRDVKAFLTLVGVEDESSIPLGEAETLATGVMMFVPIWVIFGPSSPLRFYGSISSINTDYTLFDAKQIPTRSALSIGVDLMPKTSATPSPSSNATQARPPQTRYYNIETGSMDFRRAS